MLLVSRLKLPAIPQPGSRQRRGEGGGAGEGEPAPSGAAFHQLPAPPAPGAGVGWGGRPGTASGWKQMLGRGLRAWALRGRP